LVSLKSAAAWGARALWFVLLPLLATGVALRRFVPTEAQAAGTWGEALARFGDGHRVVVAMTLFLLFSGLARHWGAWIPAAPVLRRTSTRDSVVGIAIVVALSGAVALLVRSAAGAYRVLSASMLPTLEPHDVVAGNRLAYRSPWQTGPRLPARGEVVIFKTPPEIHGPEYMIKRVIGLPGDRISMNGPHPVINGREVPSCDAGPYFYPLPSGGGVAARAYVEYLGEPHLALYAPPTEPWTGTYEVKPGEVFVLGDNRDNSLDSRSWNFGAGGGLKATEIEARASRWLFGLHRNEDIDLEHSRPLELSVRLDGLDTSLLAEGIRHCLETRPEPTEPPAAANGS
jgi:signal peptidase I